MSLIPSASLLVTVAFNNWNVLHSNLILSKTEILFNLFYQKIPNSKEPFWKFIDQIQVF